MKKILVIALVLIAAMEISSGYFLSIQSSYYATGHYLSASLRLYDRLGFPNLESMFSNHSVLKPQQREEAEINNASVNKNFPLVDDNLDDCPKKNLVKDILIPAQFNSHKVEEGLHTKYKIQFFNTPIFSKKYSSTDRGKHYLVLLAGGSEIMGYSHAENKVHILLQTRLREKFATDKITVVNSGNIAQFLTDDIAFFNQVGQILEPNLYILHTGNNDLMYTRSFHKFAQNKGFQYDPTEGLLTKYSHEFNENIDLPLLRTGNKDCVYRAAREKTMPSSFERHTAVNDQIIDYPLTNDSPTLHKFVKTLNTFLDSLEAQQVDFLVGIEGFNESSASRLEPYDILGFTGHPKKHWDELKEISSNDARVFNFNQFNNQYAWYDLNHTMPSSAEKIAAVYFDLVLLNFEDQIISFLADHQRSE